MYRIKFPLLITCAIDSCYVALGTKNIFVELKGRTGLSDYASYTSIRDACIRA
jgi:hypothetical protein